MPFACLYKCRSHILPQHKLLISPPLRWVPMEGLFGEVPEIMEQFFEQDHRPDPSFRMPLVPWSESDGGFFAPQFGYDGYGCLNESDAIPEPAISSSSAFGDLAHFINDDASSNEIEEFSCVNLQQIVPVPLCDQMPKTKRKLKVDILSKSSKRGQKRTMNSVQEDSNNSGSYMSEDQEEPSSNPQSI